MGAKVVSAGGMHTCAILDDVSESLKCWGSNTFGQLGTGVMGNKIGVSPSEMGDSLKPVNIGKSRFAKALASGDFHTCALLDNGSVKCVYPCTPMHTPSVACLL